MARKDMKAQFQNYLFTGLAVSFVLFIAAWILLQFLSGWYVSFGQFLADWQNPQMWGGLAVFSLVTGFLVTKVVDYMRNFKVI